MVGWHHQFGGHGFGWTTGVGDEQGGLTCYGSWDRRVRHDLASELKEAPGIRFAFKFNQSGFPGSSVVKNPPACAGDMGSVFPGPGRYNIPRTMKACATTMDFVL